MENNLIDRQAAINALDGNVIVTSRESAQAVMDYIRGCADRIRSLPSAQPDLDSAYTEGYTQAEAKYRALWDEMQATIKAKAFGKRKGLIHTADIDAMPTIEPEPIKEELLPDGTLHLFTDTDLSKVDRVLVSQNGTQFGDLYYADGDPKFGMWIPVDSYSAFGGDEVMWEIHGNPIAFYYCSECKEHAYAGEDGESLLTTYCPHCGARMVQEGEDNE